MAVTSASFRGNFPEFTDPTKYPDALVNFWLGIAAYFVDPDKWADLADYGTQLVLAHNLVLASINAAGNPGQGPGLTSSESAGDLSTSYDTGSVAEPNGGNWNLTTYGQQYLRTARLIGGCGTQIF